MRLGFDIDDVVADFIGELDVYLQSNYGIEWPYGCFFKPDFTDCVFHHDEEFNKKIVEDILAALRTGIFVESAKPIEGARESIQSFRKSGHKIFFISSRPLRHQPATYKWLRKHKFPFDGIRVIGNDAEKGFHGRQLNLDMFVDDLEANLESMWRYKKRWA
jgi:uncharacterized HAD superfamily protein